MDLFCGVVNLTRQKRANGRAKTCYDSQHDRPLSKIIVNPGCNRIFVKHLLCSSRKYTDPSYHRGNFTLDPPPPPPWIFHFCRELMTPPSLWNYHKWLAIKTSQLLWKSSFSRRKTIKVKELSHLWSVPNGFHLLSNLATLKHTTLPQSNLICKFCSSLTLNETDQVKKSVVFVNLPLCTSLRFVFRLYGHINVTMNSLCFLETKLPQNRSSIDWRTMLGSWKWSYF